MSDNPSHRGGQGQGRPGDEYYDERYGRPAEDQRGAAAPDPRGTYPPEPGAYPPAVVLANFKEKDVDTLLDLMKQAQVTIPLKAVVTPSNRSWVFGDLLAHLQEEHAAFTAAKENHTV